MNMLGRQHQARDEQSLADRIKLATFGESARAECHPLSTYRSSRDALCSGVFHSMREREAGQRITKANQFWRLLLLFVDSVQVSWRRLGPSVVESRERTAALHMLARNNLLLTALVNGQVVVLALNPSFGWSASLLGWMSSFSLVELLLPNRQPGTAHVLLWRLPP